MNFNPVLMKWAEKRGGGSAPETEAKTVSLALADGNQIVTPTDGKLLSEVTIEKPANLLPENIAEGVDIAGVIGSLIASGGSSVKVAVGAFAYSTSNKTISHNLGVIPDVVVLFPDAVAGSTATNRIIASLGVSSKFSGLYPSLPENIRIGFGSTSKWYVNHYDDPIDQATSGGIFYATENQFTVTGYTAGGTFLAIGGLT